MRKLDLNFLAPGLVLAAAVTGTTSPTAQAQQSIRPDPNSTYFVDVVPNGSGCPAGTVNTRISPDGLVFTTTFSAYEARVNASADIDVRECQLAIRLHTPGGFSFSVQSFSYSGYAYLQEGVKGRQTASYYWQGTPLENPPGRTDLAGPYDDDYLFKDEIELEDAVWAPCGTERDLNINTRVVLENPRLKSGFMNLTAFDGASLRVELAARRCDDSGMRGSEPARPTDPPGPQRPTDPSRPSSEKLTIGQTQVLPVDDYGNGGLLLAQKTTLRERGTLQSLSFYVNKAAGKLRLGLYDATGPSGRPGRKLAESQELTPVVGWNTAPVTPVALTPGTYWLAYLPSSNDLHFPRGGDNTGSNAWYGYAYGPLPGSFSRAPTVSTDHWSLYATVGL